MGVIVERFDYSGLSAESFKRLVEFSHHCSDCDLDEQLMELVKLRASQINGCAHCLNMHVEILRKLGASEERLQNVVVWPEASCFSDRERAALAWAEAVTLVADSRVPDDVFVQARGYFSDQELVDLTYVIITINAFNRLAVAFRRVPGS